MGSFLSTAGLAAIPTLFLAWPPCVFAQIGYLWTYEELLLKADLVVIAEQRGTVDTGRQADHPGLSPAFPVVEMQTHFGVEALLKNVDREPVAVGSSIRLKHYRHPPLGGVVNAGTVLQLQARERYLLFLTRAADGSYEPLSGHTFSTDSVYRLEKATGPVPPMRPVPGVDSRGR